MLEHFFQNHSYYLYIFLFLTGILANFIDAIAGGGGLISIPALILTGMPIINVFATNKLQSTFGTLLATYKYYKNGLIKLSTVSRGLLFGLIGAILGALLVNYISNSFMQIIVPFLLLFVFIFNLLNKKLGIESKEQKINEIKFFAIFGFILGFYDAFFGPATGNFWIISIVYFLGYTFLEASGYAKMLNLKSNLFSLLIFLFLGKVNFNYGIIMLFGSIIGGILGAKFVIKYGSELIRPIFLTIIFINLLVLFLVK
jgi:cupin 2 domain-containing protein